MKRIISNLKMLFNKLKTYIKKFFGNKTNTIIVIIILVILLVCLIMTIVNANRKKHFDLNHIYDIYPQDVRDIYANMVSVSCGGDLYFDIDANKEVKVTELNKTKLLDYLFSNLDKNEKLSNKFKVSIIKDTANDLFNEKIDLLKEIDNYQYGDYIYNIKRGMVVRTKHKCTNNNNYINHLYGFTHEKNKLSIDVNLGYVKDNTLYDLKDVKMGEYTRDYHDILKEVNTSSFYRINYVKKNNKLKLESVELISRS